MTVWYKPRPAALVEATPWLSKRATAILASYISPEMQVIEFGAGGSTLWLAERVKQVVSYEPNFEWYDVLVKKTPHNTRMVNDVFCHELPEFKADLLFIDGEPVEWRGRWLAIAPQLVKPGGIIVLDNANRPEYVCERFELLKQCEPLECVNGNQDSSLFFVTEFYRLKC